MIRKAAELTELRRAKMKGKGMGGRKGKAAELVSEADNPPIDERKPFLESH